MEKPLLSICIPTYNRAHYLKDCITSIEVQLRENPHLRPLVEVVISDNASTDTTKEVAQSFSSLFTHFVYTANEQNIGFDRNVYNVVSHAHGTYCWYLGDDDTLVNGSIDFVIKKLETNLYDLISVGSQSVGNTSYATKKEYNEKDLFETKDGNAFYHNNHNLGGFSTLIFNRDLWMKCVDLTDYLEYWLYSETPLKMFLRTDKKMLNILQTLIYTGQDCRWSENGAELTTFINSNLLLERMMYFGFKKEPIEKELSKNRKQILIILLRAKGHGLKINKKNLWFMLKNLKSLGVVHLSLLTIVFFIPNKLIVLIRDFKKKIAAH